MSTALLCYDGSDAADAAIERAGAVLGGRPALVLCVWESIGSGILRYPFRGATQLGHEVREITEEVWAALDASTEEAAGKTAAEGARKATEAGFEARPEARRAVAGVAERYEVTIWQAILEAADEHDASVIVVGSRGLSGLKSAVLGSVSYGVVHHATRPVLVVPGFP